MHEAESQHAQSDDSGEQSVRAMHELIPQHVAKGQVLAGEQTANANSAE